MLLGSRSLDVPSVLVARPGELVSRDEIIAAVWPGMIVEDSNLPTQISGLRRVLDAGRSAGSCIQTISGRGYRFVGAVTRHDAAIDAGTSRASQGQLRIFSPDGVEPSARPSPIPSVERRQLTLMICDLAGAAMLASRLDPEELREIMAAYHRAVTEMVAGYDGFVGSCMGDTVLACFGYPRAHEDDAERAVRAGLGVIDAVGCLDAKSFKLRPRVGLPAGWWSSAKDRLRGNGSSARRRTWPPD